MKHKTKTTPSALDQYLRDINRIALLTVDEERRLAHEIRDRGDTRAAHRLVEANLRFVVKVAFEYRWYGLPMPDLIQEGNIGLMRAVQKFEPDREIRLISYAVWWIRAFIQGHVLKSWSLVKIGTTQAQRKLFFSLARTRREIARLSVGAPPDPERDDVDLVDARERHIVELRIMGDRDETLRALGRHFGFSRERARQLQLRGLDKLRRELRPLADEMGWPVSPATQTDG